MLQVTLLSVNVAQPGIIGTYRGQPVTSAIGKKPVTAPELYLDWTNLQGDRQADLTVHGGPDKAVYAYPSEHIEAWAAELNQELGPGAFGENLTVAGWLEQDVYIGDVWAWGDALLQVTQPRQPCYKLATYRRRFDLPKKLVTKGRSGWYLRVLQPGQVPVRGPIEVIERDPAGISVLQVNWARLLGRGTPAELRAMTNLPALTQSWRQEIELRLGSPAAR
jgi:MOSC domain-containing protein YiiM